MTSPPLQLLEHQNKFESEADFLVHYGRARIIARDPRNHIRRIDGQDLLGVPMYVDTTEPDADGVEKGPGRLPGPRQVLTTTEGRPVWRVPPPGGWAVDASGQWYAVPFLAPHLQTTIIARDANLSQRVTPEVRVERGMVGPVLIRTLTVELNLLGVRTLGSEMQDAFRDSMLPLVRMWFPLHVQVESETLCSSPGPRRNATPMTALMFRFRAQHEQIELVG